MAENSRLKEITPELKRVQEQPMFGQANSSRIATSFKLQRIFS